MVVVVVGGVISLSIILLRMGWMSETGVKTSLMLYKVLTTSSVTGDLHISAIIGALIYGE